MKITVTTTSTSLKDLLGTKIASIGNSVVDGTVSIQNLGTSDIYIETFSDATTTDSFKIASGFQAQTKINYIDRTYLITGVENTNVRVIII